MVPAAVACLSMARNRRSNFAACTPQAGLGIESQSARQIDAAEQDVAHFLVYFRFAASRQASRISAISSSSLASTAAASGQSKLTPDARFLQFLCPR